MIKPVKASLCPKCSGWVRCGVPDYIDNNEDAKKEFHDEVKNYNLNVSTMPLAEFEKVKACGCDEMDIKTALDILQKYNAWRRQNDDKPRLEMPNPTDIGRALDFAIENLKNQIT